MFRSTKAKRSSSRNVNRTVLSSSRRVNRDIQDIRNSVTRSVQATRRRSRRMSERRNTNSDNFSPTSPVAGLLPVDLDEALNNLDNELISSINSFNDARYFNLSSLDEESPIDFDVLSPNNPVLHRQNNVNISTLDEESPIDFDVLSPITTRYHQDVINISSIQNSPLQPPEIINLSDRSDSENDDHVIDLCNQTAEKLVESRENSPKVGECPICMESFHNKRVFTPSCGHLFCEQCIRDSLKIKKQCPICRKKAKNILRIFLFNDS